jgi:KDO2-lipid IV(A) lauroyltransferase
LSAEDRPGAFGARHAPAARGERGRERLTYWGYRAAEAVLSALPRSVVIPAAAAVGNAAYDLGGDKREVVRLNMAQVLGLPVDEPRVRRAARQAFQNYGRYLADVMRLGGQDPEDARKRVTYHGYEQLAAAHGPEGRGVLICTIHVGAIDLLAPALQAEGEPMYAVADDSTYGRLFDHLAAVRQAKGVEIIGWRSMRRLYRVLAAGGNLVLLCDGAFRPGDVPVEWLGAATTFPAGPALLSARTGSAILPIGVRRTPHDRMDVWGYPLIRAASTEPAEIHRATQALADALGDVLVRDPGQWYMFRSVWPRTAAERADAAAALERAQAGEDWTAGS